MLITIYVRTCLVYLGKCMFSVVDFYLIFLQVWKTLISNIITGRHLLV